MTAAEHTVSIQRPPADVFAFIADGETAPQWRPGVTDVTHVSGDGVGAVYRQGVKGPFGRRVPADYEITAHEPGRLLAFRAIAGPVRPTGRYELAPDGEGTRVRFSLACELGGLKRLMAPGVHKSMRAEVASLDRLRAVLERR
jgi:carbon monoxide dehydrogenase subunit G